MQEIKWDNRYRLNIMEIDLQHIKFVELIEELGENIEHNPHKENMRDIFQKLFAYMETHFTTEEKYFEEFKYEEREEHIKQHHIVREKVKTLEEKYAKTESLQPMVKLQNYLWNWITSHIMTWDERYKECFKANGL